MSRVTRTRSPLMAGDLLIVISHSGEAEVVAAWCKIFEKMVEAGAEIFNVGGMSSAS